VIKGFHDLSEVWNESSYEVDLSGERLQGFLIFRERDFLDGFNFGRIDRDVVLGDDVS